ncbi:long-chain-alcohol oxidase-like [Raphidocelis subcapitata]|uniref:long-chain-alcohol oxidase n=1 Tax=Raphidocelis subcapitata TaxID=307507 RepID=A0A2V0PF46_9CHLO|nr:long-chain-alcohol oxidase-like [Raphidocelis subcapitata]|eukprot:GBF98468.1 long-chain-alcohol oxidase-like [Raphidocelis subcapitata]
MAGGTGVGTAPTIRDSAVERAQLKVLRSLADAIWPSEPAPDGASDAEARFYATSGAEVAALPEQALLLIQKRLMGYNKGALLLVLYLLSWPLATLLLAGRHALSPSFPWLPRAYPDLPLKQRQAALLAWRHHWIKGLRAAYKAIKSVIVAVVFSSLDAAGANPFFGAVNYPGGAPKMPEPAPSPEALQAEEVLASAVVDARAALAAAGPAGLGRYLERRGLRPAQPSDAARAEAARAGREGGALAAVLSADAVVVGSGAGGGVAAAQLAAAGLRVVVIEKGSWKRMADLTLLESESTQEMFERGAFLTTDDGGMSILAGATMGGGTKINWCASLRTPDHVRREWADRHGLPAFATPAYDSSLDAVLSRLGVQETTRLNGNNGALFDGLCELGADARQLPRNCRSDECSGHCSLGCKTGHKVSTDVSYLADAARHGARILTGARARRVITEAAPAPVRGGARASEVARARVAAGVELVIGGDEDDYSSGTRVVVMAPLVIASAGSIHNPALLLRSGVTCGGNVGAHLRLHPAFGVMGVFDKRQAHCGSDTGTVDMYQGAMMLTYSLSAANWEQGGYGAMVSVPSLHPGLMAACHPWNPLEFKNQLIRMQDIAVSVIFARDRGGGRVTVDGRGRPRVHYWPTPETARSVLEGMELALRAYMAAGAESVTLPHAFGHLVAHRDQGEAGLEAMIADAYATGVEKFDMPLFSAHQMGSCRMGSSPRDSVCDGSGEVWEVSGLFVADASAFPTASGVNPMITAMAIAHMVSSGIAARAAAARKASLLANGGAGAGAGRGGAARGGGGGGKVSITATAAGRDDGGDDVRAARDQAD